MPILNTMVTQFENKHRVAFLIDFTEATKDANRIGAQLTRNDVWKDVLGFEDSLITCVQRG